MVGYFKVAEVTLQKLSHAHHIPVTSESRKRKHASSSSGSSLGSKREGSHAKPFLAPLESFEFFFKVRYGVDSCNVYLTREDMSFETLGRKVMSAFGLTRIEKMTYTDCLGDDACVLKSNDDFDRMSYGYKSEWIRGS
ncbi:hypothetical protein QVD17_09828 [Tagetes erecta]|uniref:PB1 domain-containing protein n=1 Tax=Tagetes erecta TaxID=13708 RepID=A0AAD8L844_TARER|nr:hypothetical protein QVD17_09828 [Tagetes erecta]